jgi:hypothetical protein
MIWGKGHAEDPQILGASVQKVGRHDDSDTDICATLLHIIRKRLSRYFIRQYFDFVALCRHSVQETLCSSAFVMNAGCIQGHSNCSEEQVTHRDEEVNQFHRRDVFSVNIRWGLQ